MAKQTVYVPKKHVIWGLPREYIIPMRPFPKVRMTQHDLWKPAAQKYFKNSAKLRDLAPSICWYPLNIRFIFKMPKSWPNKKKEAMLNQLHIDTPDTDNLIKAVKDSLLEQDSMVGQYGDISKVWGLYDGIAVSLEKEGQINVPM